MTEKKILERTFTKQRVSHDLLERSWRVFRPAEVCAQPSQLFRTSAEEHFSPFKRLPSVVWTSELGELLLTYQQGFKGSDNGPIDFILTTLKPNPSIS